MRPKGGGGGIGRVGGVWIRLFVSKHLLKKTPMYHYGRHSAESSKKQDMNISQEQALHASMRRKD